MYSSITSSIGTDMDKGLNTISIINEISFQSFWSSNAGDALVESLEMCTQAFYDLVQQLGDYNDALVLTDEYKKIVEEIERLQSLLVNVVGDDEEAEAARAAYAAQINALMIKKNELRQKIEAILSSIGVVSVESNNISYTYNGDFNELVGKMKEFNNLGMTNDLFGALTVKDEDGNIIRDGEKYFNTTIDNVRKMHTGADKTFYTTLALVDLCIEAGVRPRYRHAGTGTGGIVTHDRSLRVPVPSSAISSGSDCNAVASFLVFNDDSRAKWLSTAEFREPDHLLVDDNDVVSGDVCTKTGHVAILMGYDSETDQYMLYEAKGTEVGHKMTLMNGESFRSIYEVRKIDSSYVPYWL